MSGTPLDVLERIRQWDMLDVAADGAYWKREIDAALSSVVLVPKEPTEAMLQSLLSPGEAMARPKDKPHYTIRARARYRAMLAAVSNHPAKEGHSKP